MARFVTSGVKKNIFSVIIISPLPFHFWRQLILGTNVPFKIWLFKLWSWRVLIAFIYIFRFTFNKTVFLYIFRRHSAGDTKTKTHITCWNQYQTGSIQMSQIGYWHIPKMFYSQALTNLKTADTFSMKTLFRMMKIENTSPVNRSRATGHNHQLSETTRENTSNQAHLANYQEWRKRTIKHLKCILQNYHSYFCNSIVRPELQLIRLLWIVSRCLKLSKVLRF